MPLRITGGQDSFVRRIYAPGDLVTINAGTKNGIEVGQEYYVRRLQVANRERHLPRPRRRPSARPAGSRSTPWTTTCRWPRSRTPATRSRWTTTSSRSSCRSSRPSPRIVRSRSAINYGKVLVGTDRRTSFGKGDYFVVNRGSDHGIEVGSQFVLYRDKKQAENFLFEIGEGIATEVKAEMTTMQVTVSLDAIESGDYVALRREPEKK